MIRLAIKLDTSDPTADFRSLADYVAETYPMDMCLFESGAGDQLTFICPGAETVGYLRDWLEVICIGYGYDLGQSGTEELSTEDEEEVRKVARQHGISLFE